MILSPSLLSADFGNLEQALKDLENSGLSWVHWDVMDGLFVPNITFGQHVIKMLRPKSKLFFDVHLMIEKPERYLEDFKKAGADMLVIHAEATNHIQRTLAEIRRLGMRAGLALNPATPLNVCEYVLDDTDMILLMSVNPGFGGQSFIPATYEKSVRSAKCSAAGNAISKSTEASRLKIRKNSAKPALMSWFPAPPFLLILLSMSAIGHSKRKQYNVNTIRKNNGTSQRMCKCYPCLDNGRH